MDVLLKAFWRRVGLRARARLNSLALIGKRLAGESRRSGGHQLYAGGDREQHSRADEDLADIKRSDRAGVLHPQLFRRAAGFRKLVDEFGRDEVLIAAHTVVTRAMIDDRRLRSVRTWEFFRSSPRGRNGGYRAATG